MSYTYSNLTGSVLLRADPNSQVTTINEEGNKKNLISEKLFWGDGQGSGLYFDYKSKKNSNGYTVPYEGWNDYSEKETERMDISKTVEWINKRILHYNGINLCVIQGYAGCGKTTFVKSILRNAVENGTHFSYYNFYIGHIKNSDETTFIPTSIQAKMVDQITISLKNDSGMEIYDKFMELCNLNISDFSSNLSTYFAPVLRSKSNASLYKYAQEIYNSRNNEDVEKHVTEYRVQFNNSFDSAMGKMRYNKNNFNNKSNQLDILLCTDYLWRCAVSLVKKTPILLNQIVVYDNLDIIDDIKTTVDFIDTLRSVLSNYESFKSNQNKLDLPTFKAILTVRKITYASISRFNEVTIREMNQMPIDTDFLDISNLYSSSSVLKHKAKILINNLNEIIPNNAICRKDIELFLNELIKIPENVLSEIKFSELLNHNIRACANMIETMFSSYAYKQYFSNAHTLNVRNNKCTSAIWIHIICNVLKNMKVWNSLGYNLSNTQNPYYPTTLSRMILTYLRNYRLGYMRDTLNITSSDVSFIEIIRTFEKLPFQSFNRNTSWENIASSLEKSYDIHETHKLIIRYISKMLQRNKSAEKVELWRRPIYFTRNSFELSSDEAIENALNDQLVSNKNATYFCITDEGNTFVEKIATHFEFYSVRYNNCATKPLCCVHNKDELDNLIQQVYNQVKLCVVRQVWLMNYYVKKYQVTKNEYLNEWYHPRTDEFYPQLHIVRTIYDHIVYLNNYRDIICETNPDLDKINSCLVDWIGKYLELYRKYLYNILEDTDGKYNNEVWLDLKYLYWIVSRDKNKKGINPNDKKYVSIKRSTGFSRKNQFEYSNEYRISDEELIKE